MLKNVDKQKIRGLEFFPLWLLLLFVIMIVAISQTDIDVSEEQLSLIQTITLSYIAINISLLLFILPSLANKRDLCKEVLETIEDGPQKKTKTRAFKCADAGC